MENKKRTNFQGETDITPGAEGGFSDVSALGEQARGSDSPPPVPGIDSDGAIKRESNRPEHDSMDNERRVG